MDEENQHSTEDERLKAIEEALKAGYTNVVCSDCHSRTVRALHSPRYIALACETCGLTWSEKS